MKDLNQIVKVEKAIAQKYGEDAIANPKHYWNEEKEREYIEQLKELSQIEKRNDKDQKIEVDGIFISKKLLTKDTNRTCPICSVYSFDLKDDLYMNRFECCQKCYVQWVEGREERWKTGWRPNKK
ncbi:MAG: hypothetical protein EBU01_16360 [Crocinitomicaceae bacterium]|jgi:hypothetical protein|nr:hypothetical protein [Crocinitomicaceae bacterium]